MEQQMAIALILVVLISGATFFQSSCSSDRIEHELKEIKRMLTIIIILASLNKAKNVTASTDKDADKT